MRFSIEPRSVYFKPGILLAFLIAGCGAPQAAVTLATAHDQAIPATLPAEDEAVRAGIRSQFGAWNQLSQILHQPRFAGMHHVDANFVDLVDRTAAAATRASQLIDAHQDDPQQNRRLLQEFDNLWHKTAAYLKQ